MAQVQYRARQSTFGKLQGGGVAAPRPYQAPQPYSPPSAAYGHSSGLPNSAEYGGGGTGRVKLVKGRRFLSGLIDFCIVSVLGGIILMIQYGLGGGLTELLSGGLLKFYVWFGAVCFIYGLAMEASAAQGTVGKLATGTIVVNEDGQAMSFNQALGRNLGKFLTYIVPLYIGYLMVLWTKKSQSLHDKMAGTVVCSKAAMRSSYAETFA